MNKKSLVLIFLYLFAPVMAKEKESKLVVKNTKTADPEHGCGQPDALHIIEDEAAGIKPVEDMQPKKKPGKFRKKKKIKKEKKAQEPRRTISKMSFDELLGMGNKKLANGEKEAAIKFYEKA